MADAPRVGELLKAGRVTDGDLDAVILAYLQDPKPGPRAIAEGVVLDVAAASRMPCSLYSSCCMRSFWQDRSHNDEPVFGPACRFSCGFRLKSATGSEAKPASVPI
ncbi:hypothetical protein [Methylobacterium sp. WSM2598]|uniref:hypothetical protein n=1 Tax=Methylobacterium sp. WSM2598 TaxID=398261 RepID=UPI0012F64068|nr:hypothetical protein [Methylobacterium sp. WSM2598]